MPEKPQSRSGESKAEGVRRWSWRRILKYAVSAVAAFGIFGAIGGKVVDEYFDTTVEAVRGEDPLVVAIGYETDYSDGFSLVTRTVGNLDAQLTAVDSCPTLGMAARNAGAVDLYDSTLHMVLEGRTVRTVSIVGVRAIIDRRTEPLSGALVHCASAGDNPALGWYFDLDEADPVAREINEDGTPGPPFFATGRVITFAKGEIVPFKIIARTDEAYVAWRMELDLVIDGKRETMIVNENGDPLEVTAVLPDSAQYERYYEWLWFEQPARLHAADEPFFQG